MVSTDTDGNGHDNESMESLPAEEPHEVPAAEAVAEDAKRSEPPRSPLEEVTSERDRLKDQLLRTAADFDNFRKRTKRDAEDADRRGREDMLKDLLPIIDNLERAVAASDSATDVGAVAQGVRMVLRQFEDVGGRIGIQRVKTVGERFDPMQHDAVQQLETDEHPPGTVVSEIVPGYQMGNKLVRAALVVVARPPAASPEEGEGSSG